MAGTPVVANATADGAGVDVGFDGVLLPADVERVRRREAVGRDILQLVEGVACDHPAVSGLL